MRGNQTYGDRIERRRHVALEDLEWERRLREERRYLADPVGRHTTLTCDGYSHLANQLRLDWLMGRLDGQAEPGLRPKTIHVGAIDGAVVAPGA